MKNFETKLDMVIATAMIFGASLIIVGMLIGTLIIKNEEPEFRGTYEENVREEALESTETVLAALGLWHIE